MIDIEAMKNYGMSRITKTQEWKYCCQNKYHMSEKEPSLTKSVLGHAWAYEEVDACSHIFYYATLTNQF